MIRPIAYILFIEEALRDLQERQARALLYRAASVKLEQEDQSLSARCIRFLASLEAPDPQRIHDAGLSLLGQAPLLDDEGPLPQLRALVLGAFRSALQELAGGLCQAGSASLRAAAPAEPGCPFWIITVGWLGADGELQEATTGGLSEESALEEMARDLLAWRRSAALSSAVATLQPGIVWRRGDTWRALKQALEVLHPYDDSPGATLIRVCEELMGLPDDRAMPRLREQVALIRTLLQQPKDLQELMRRALEAQAQADAPTVWRVRGQRPGPFVVARQIASSWGVPQIPTAQSSAAQRVLEQMAERGEVLKLGAVPREGRELEELAEILQSQRAFLHAWPPGITLLGVEGQLYLAHGIPRQEPATAQLWQAIRIFPLGSPICADAPAAPFLLKPTYTARVCDGEIAFKPNAKHISVTSQAEPPVADDRRMWEKLAHTMNTTTVSIAPGSLDPVAQAGLEFEALAQRPPLEVALNNALEGMGRGGGVRVEPVSEEGGEALEVRGLSTVDLRPMVVPDQGGEGTITGAQLRHGLEALILDEGCGYMRDASGAAVLDVPGMVGLERCGRPTLKGDTCCADHMKLVQDQLTHLVIGTMEKQEEQEEQREGAIHVVLPGHVDRVDITIGFDFADHALLEGREGLLALLRRRMEQLEAQPHGC